MLKSALEQMFSAKTLTMWAVLALVALIAFLVASFVAVVFKISLESYFNDLLQFLGVGGGISTTRNVISDGVAPRIPMAIGARTDPSVSLESPSPMTLKPPAPTTNYAAPPVAPTAPTGGSS